ncbi:glucoamylase family protein [Streptomyces albipurpureus]|uniref:DUF3131 domain-containing protein n=1 Tax=Streptomyces albipurpureus TaxID=2897419 RepID=A0ABT0UG90_9ACTN|nr:glucoamylase family protein [Streptomyces sp. CWNU-1]MCM2387434.1 DUF3131 domain-containing protein [Streptomyces sp. CWNU-1]
MRRRTLIQTMGATLGATALTPALAGPALADGSPQPAGHRGRPKCDERLTRRDRATLRRYAADTWRSLDALVSPETGLPGGFIDAELTTRGHQTGPTPFGTYLWCATAAWKIGLITRRQARDRVRRTLTALSQIAYHAPSGMFHRWYDPYTGDFKDDTLASRFVSSVDNAWTATGLMVVERAFPELNVQIRALLDRMDFDWFYVPNAPGGNVGGGLMRGGFYDVPTGGTPPTVHDPVRGVYYTPGTYGAMGETRQVTYVAMALGQVPDQAYFGQNRSFPPTRVDQETKPSGFWQTYRGVRVWEGAYEYRGMKVMPTWGGSMFEFLMSNLFVPEEVWGPDSWGVNLPLAVRSQIEHGLEEAQYGYWGFSPCNNPAGGYRVYGVDAIGINRAGYSSDQENTLVDPGFDGHRPPAPPPANYGDGVVTPHAAFLALRYAPREAIDNLRKLERDFDCYGPGGFYDSIAVRSGQMSREHLTLDQGMVMAALGNALAGDVLRDLFTAGRSTQLRSCIAEERFAAAPRV